jgi:ubiquinone/menaquinone biosynthesis C-methylase UbiE
MTIKEAYDIWAKQYDTNNNRTRDLEAVALRQTLSPIVFNSCLEIGCGTGKNTAWLHTRAKETVAIDFSDQMLAKAKEKIQNDAVVFHQADITAEWNFAKRKFDIVVFSLVLEHIEDLEKIFEKTAKVLIENGYVYIGELHPFKQYAGTKARFDTEDDTTVLTCYDHAISDFTNAAKKYGFDILELNEFFDDANKKSIPRILTLLLRKTKPV